MDGDALASVGVIAMLLAWVVAMGVGKRHVR
jgi:hypothetical protein